MKYDIYSLGLMVAFISFLGFMLENLWLAVTKGYMNNRNMNMPFLLGYGLLVVAMYFALGTPESMVLLGTAVCVKSKKSQVLLYFLCAMLIVSLGEIILGTTMEKICGIEYWNYTWIPMHITKYTSVPTSIGFASIITFFMGECFEPIMNGILKINPDMVKISSVLLMILMLGDFCVSFYTMYKKRDLNEKWHKEIKHKYLRI